MNQLFIELYLDEDVDVTIATLLRARGFQTVTTQEARQTSNDDARQLAYAISRQMTLLTHNRVDFERLAEAYFNSGKHHDGIIIDVRRPPFEILRRLLVILNTIAADEMKDQLRYI